uniref:BCL2 interacting protein 1 n=1 Tax=Canis lupus familiaris TaxID=9615 RepID=A0A8C0PJP7_CANLF
MAAPQDVHVRICNQEIVKFDLEVKALIQDIRDCSGPLSALTELNTKVKEKFQQLRHRIQELEQSAKEQDKESEKQVLLQEVENHKKQMLSNQTSWRKANLTCKIAIDNLEKAELLQGGDLLRQRKTTKESLAQTSSAITESLMGISRMMSQQVQQSEEAMQTLGKARSGVRNFSQRLQFQSPCPGTCHHALPPLSPSPPSSPSLLTCVASHFFNTVVLPGVGYVALTSLFGFYSCTTRSTHPRQNVSPAEAFPRSHVKSRDPQAFWRVGASRTRGRAWASVFFPLEFCGPMWPGRLGNHCLGRCFSVSAAG